MDILDALLGAGTLAFLAMGGSLVLAFRSLIMWTSHRPVLSHQLAQLEATMAALLAEIPKKMERIRAREKQLPPLKRQYQKMRDYEKVLNALFLAAEQEEADSQDKSREIKTKGKRYTKKTE